MKKTMLVGVAAAVMVSGCTFVKPTQHADEVLVLKPHQTRECEQLRRSTSQVLDKIWFINRNREKMAEELEILARNTAAEIGGNAVVADSEIDAGKQRFIIYNCPHLR